MTSSFKTREEQLDTIYLTTTPDRAECAKIQCHSAVQIVYNEQRHSIQHATLDEIRTILEKICGLLALHGIKPCKQHDVIEVHARVTLRYFPLPLSPANVDALDDSNGHDLDHPRAFGYL